MTPWATMQVADSALPTGSFAHSGGLEAAAQLGRCGDANGLGRLLEEALWSIGASALPFVSAALQEPERLTDWDARCDATLPGHVANRASRVQGRAFLRAMACARPSDVGPLARRVDAERIGGHLAPVFGAVLSCLGAQREEAARLYLFHAARAMVSAGVRLGITGPLEGQGLLAGAEAVVEGVLAACLSRPPADAASTSPVLDLLQGHQDRLYSRLFQS